MQKLAKIEYDQGNEIGNGQGMNSKVFLSTDPQLGGTLAVKEIPKNNFPHVAEFWSEARAMFSAAHEHVVPIQYACETADHICLAMPYYRQGSLTDRIKAGPLRPQEVVRVGQGILSGLAQIHIAGHLHFDLKPSNVLFSDSDQPMVADFGQARAIGPSGVTRPPDRNYCVGIPPEVLAVRAGTVESDVYQAGLTLYRAANGDPFFQTQLPSTHSDLATQILSGTFPDRNAFMPHVPRAMKKVLRKALQVNPVDRFASAREFATALGRVCITKDWATVCLPNNEIEWLCQQPAGHRLAVRLRADSVKWKVEIHNEKPGTRRATKRILWRAGLTRKQVMTHLQQVFEALE